MKTILARAHWATKGFAASPIGATTPETPDETCWSLKTSISCETSPILTLGHIGKRKILQLSRQTWRRQRLQTRHVEASKQSFRVGLQLKNLRFPKSFDKKLKICPLKIDVSCEDSAKFHHVSQNTTPATDFALCHHFPQPCQCDSQKHATRHL